jgi:hypothetical protein
MTGLPEVLLMPSLVGAVVTGGVALSLVASAPLLQQAAPQSPQAQVPAASAADAIKPEQFAGSWAYNADESINAYSGKPELAPTRPGANARAGSGSSGRQPQPGGGGSSGGGGNPGNGTNPGGGNPGPTGLGGTGGGSQTPPYPGPSMPGMGGMGSMSNAPGSVDPGVWRGGWAAAWARSAARDLLEVPWRLTVEVTPQAVTIIDDLERSRTYLTDGKKKKFQLGAAVFNAKTTWEGPRLKKEIDAASSFKMTETYFLSEDASRLFVIIRLGDPRQANAKNAPVAGVNRVYDRAQR